MTFVVSILWDDYDYKTELNASAIDYDKLFKTFDAVTIHKSKNCDRYSVTILIDDAFDPLHSGAHFVHLWDSCKYIR